MSSVAGGGSIAAVVADELERLGVEASARDVRFFLAGFSVGRLPRATPGAATEEAVRGAVRVFDWSDYRATVDRDA